MSARWRIGRTAPLVCRAQSLRSLRQYFVDFSPARMFENVPESMALFG
jgi:hypothetical protein